MAEKLDPKAQAKAFEKYIAGKKILIADPSGASRASIANILASMGAKTVQFTLASSYLEAEDAIERLQPGVVIADYDLGKRCGLDLLQKQRLHNKSLAQSLFVLVTGNTSQSAVAKAAEEDVDTYIIKPFTAGVFRASVMKAALMKTDPPEYLKILDRGKEELIAGKAQEALRTFEYATTLDAAPSLGHFYSGQAHNLLKATEVEEGSYNKGLEYNKIHYKCLVGLYENFAARKRHHEAYAVIKKVSHYFPANPQRLTAVLRLAIVTQSYEDVERYYRIFTSIDDRNEEMIKYICAALVVCGKYYLQQNFGSRALELFQKAAITASGRTRILREIITSLLDFGLAKQADEFLRRFPPESQKGVDYQAMSLLIMDQTSPRTLVIEKGRELLSQNLRDPIIYRVLIRRSAEHGLTHALEDLINEARKHFPDQSAIFEKAAKTPKAAPASSSAAGVPSSTGTPSQAKK
ncbi:MAG: response regulator [Oligoflexia bacterium]|nr:response regulator [Oligoflexia bacterium]